MTTLGDKIITRMEAFTTQLENGEDFMPLKPGEDICFTPVIYVDWEELAVAVNNWSMANFASQSRRRGWWSLNSSSCTKTDRCIDGQTTDTPLIATCMAKSVVHGQSHFESIHTPEVNFEGR